MTSDVIRLLPDAVANQIAAGEVIQRPASVVKELVENAIDAGADSVSIVVKDAGRTLIQVIDNGCGMTPTDARMAFERHATSKISAATDLFSLHTMGFRGEALPSIAAVARIELRTQKRGESVGCRLRISESKYEGSEPCAAATGTNIMVKDLFFHMPARRKFLKKDNVELAHIMREFERLALVNANVDFSISSNDQVLHALKGGPLKQRIHDLFGKQLGGQMIEIGTETDMVKISGYVATPQSARKRGVQQFFFVNGRNMLHPYFRKAVLACYESLILPEYQPSFFINFEVDPATIDVNIHPQKHEIKFENEQPIYQILQAAVREALGKINAAGAIDFDNADELPDIPVFSPDANATMPGILTDPGYNPFEPESSRRTVYREQRAGEKVPQNWERLYDAFNSSAATAPAQPVVANLFDEQEDAQGQAPAVTGSQFTLANKFVVLPSKEGLMLIHRTRAQVRVLYDRLVEQLAGRTLDSQQLLFPETLTLSPANSATLTASEDIVRSLGFNLSFLGDNTWAINSVPLLPGNVKGGELLLRLIEEIEMGNIPGQHMVVEKAAVYLARSAAATAAVAMSDADTESLVAHLLASQDANYTPDGLKIIHLLPLAEMGSWF